MKKSKTFTSEEDIQSYTSETTDASSIDVSDSNSIASSCTNSDPYTLEPYTDEEPELLIIKVQNSQGKFVKGECVTRELLVSLIKSDEADSYLYSSENPIEYTPKNVMAIWTTPRDKNRAGYESKPTGKWVFKLPNLIYITLGSFKRLMQNKSINEWYALPLYNNKRRRVGNIRGVFGMSMNHGQLPGFRIFKLFTKEEIRSSVEVKETRDDYPLEIAPNGDYQVLEMVNESSLYIMILHSIARYHTEDIDVYT